MDAARQFIGRPVSALPTPCLTLDRPALERNLGTLQAEAQSAGKALRPHAKSHKCTRLAHRQVELGAAGICAAKLSEGERLAAAGLPGVLITGPMVTAEAHERLARAVAAGGDLIITLESEETARRISQALGAFAPGKTLPFLLDLDIGQGRTGVDPQSAAEVAARLAALPQLRLLGVQAYAGHIQHLPTRAERESASRCGMKIAGETLRALGLAGGGILSGGGTGSYTFDLDSDITEIQPGSYALMDADYLAVEPSDSARGHFAPALKLRTTVMSTLRRSAGYVTVDAGLKSLYSDGPAPLVVQPGGGTLVYDWYGDEYGRITGSAEELAALPVGAALELIVSHCDPTVNLFDFYYLVEGGTVIDLWPIDLRGCSS